MEDIYRKTENLIDKIRGLDLTEKAMEMIGFKPSGDYTIDDLMQLEEFIEKAFPVEKAYGALFLPLGWYFGKTIIKNIEGSFWIGDGNDILGLGINFSQGKGITIYPFARARKFLKNREDGMACFFEMTVFLINGGMEKMQDVEYLKKIADEDGWVNFPETNNSKGFKIRLTAILSMKN